MRGQRGGELARRSGSACPGLTSSALRDDRGAGAGEGGDARQLLGAGAGRRLDQQLVGGLAAVEDLAGQAVEDHQAEREQVGAPVDVGAARLLGRHEADVPLDHPVLGLGRRAPRP